jgi:hypothetical protein
MRRFALLIAIVGMLVVPASASAVAANFSWTSKGRLANVGGSLDAVDCPSVRLCVAGGGKAIWVTSAPTGRTTGWKRVAVSQPHATLGASYIFEVSCPTVTFCAVGDSNTNLISSSTPATATRASWTAKELPNGGSYAGITGLSCTSPTFCAALDFNGAALVSTAPATSVWGISRLEDDSTLGISDVDCVGTSCVAVYSDANVWVTADASAQSAVWRKVRIGNASRYYQAVACLTTTTCIATGRGPIRVSTNIAGGPATWKAITLAGELSVEHVSCRVGLCTATAGTDVWWSATPSVARSWKKSTTSRNGVILSDSACPTVRMCVATDVGGQVWVGTR